MLTRRRFLSIAASAALLGTGATASARRAPGTETLVWRGTAMGAEASIRIAHPDRAVAERLIPRWLAEIDRLEGIFSLHRGDSTLVRLNSEGVVRRPPLEFVELLGFALAVARQSGGAFDPTVQPLFRLYAEHFASPDASPAGPSDEAIRRALERVGHRHVAVDAAEVRLTRPGMGVTLNGVAQGYVTDRIADILRQEGLTDVLLDLGEVRALGMRGDGTPWRAAIAAPGAPGEDLAELPLSDRDRFAALSTSAGAGTPFDREARHHHIFDPRTGRSAQRHLAVSVAARRAVVADALSTALSVLPQEAAAPLLANYRPARAYLVSAERTVVQLDV
jgi:thiamine biosynthesis lipoprotein